jgi:hypothetical protein
MILKVETRYIGVSTQQYAVIKIMVQDGQF